MLPLDTALELVREMEIKEYILKNRRVITWMDIDEEKWIHVPKLQKIKESGGCNLMSWWYSFSETKTFIGTQIGMINGKSSSIDNENDQCTRFLSFLSSVPAVQELHLGSAGLVFSFIL